MRALPPHSLQSQPHCAGRAIAARADHADQGLGLPWHPIPAAHSAAHRAPFFPPKMGVGK